MNDARDILAQLEKCPVRFDPSADHDHGTAQPHRVAFVPVEVFEAVKRFLAIRAGSGTAIKNRFPSACGAI